jgi:hypothetical protein
LKNKRFVGFVDAGISDGDMQLEGKQEEETGETTTTNHIF